MFCEPHGSRRREEFIRDGGRWQRHLDLPAQFQSELHVFLHHVNVKPRLIGHLQHERAAILKHRRAGDTVQEYLQRNFTRDAALFGKQDAFGECQELHGETEIGRNLHHERQPVFADVGDLRSEIEEQRFDSLKCFGPAADHHGEFSLLDSNDASRDRRIYHVGALFPNSRSESA